MNRSALVPLFALALLACSDERESTPSSQDQAAAEPAEPETQPKAPPEAEPEAEPEARPEAEPTIAEAIAEPELEPELEPDAEAELEPTPVPAPDEIAIVPWSTSPATRSWALLASPAEALTLVDLDAGVLGKAGAGWSQLGDGDALIAATMDVEPSHPIVGVWPSDAWFVDQRWRKYDDSDEEYLELRLMKLRGGKRWVPQVYSGTGEQWFHPGTDDELKPRMSTRSGMLVYGTFSEIIRVAGKYDDPTIGAHRGEVVDFIEAGSGKIYVLSRDADGVYAQIECEDDECVAAQAKKFPAGEWSFGRQVPRGRHSVSVLASSGGREFVLHHRGKSDGWILDELPAGERPIGMWASEEGGLWTLAGERLRWRDTDSNWHDVAVPEGLTGLSVAVTEDRKRVVIAGVVGGAAKLYATNANAEAAAP